MQPTHLIVTFLGRVGGASRPQLGLLDIATFSFRVVRFPQGLTPDEEALGGVALNDDYLFVASPRVTLRPAESTPPSDILVFDRRDLRLVNQYRCHLASDAHSLALRGDR